MKQIETIFATDCQGEGNHAFQWNKKNKISRKTRIYNKGKKVTTFQLALILLQQLVQRTNDLHETITIIHHHYYPLYYVVIII